MFIRREITLCLMLVTILFGLAGISPARDVSFNWTANQEQIEGYRLYYKIGSTGGPPYDNSVETGNVTTYTLADLNPTQTYYFVLTAFNGADESAPSEELMLAADVPGQPPTAAFNASIQNNTSLTVNFDASGSTNSPNSFHWNYGDGSTGTGITTTHIYPADGNYTITLTVTNTNGEDTLTQTIQLNNTIINRVPTAGISAGSGTGPAPLMVTFDGSSSTDPDNDTLSYNWDFGDGGTNTSTAQTSHTFLAPGTYTTRLTVNDGKGGSASASLPVIVTASTGDDPTTGAAAAVIIATKYSDGKDGTEFFTVTFDGSKSSASSIGSTISQYAWNFGDGSTGTGARVNHTYLSSYSYTTTLTVIDSMGKQAHSSMVVQLDTLEDENMAKYLIPNIILLLLH